MERVDLEEKQCVLLVLKVKKKKECLPENRSPT